MARRAAATLGRDAGAQAAAAEFLAQPVGVVALVAQEPPGMRQPSQKPERAVHLAWQEKEGQRPAVAVARHVELGGRPALRAPDRPRAEPPSCRGSSPCGAPWGCCTVMTAPPSTPVRAGLGQAGDDASRQRRPQRFTWTIPLSARWSSAPGSACAPLGRAARAAQPAPSRSQNRLPMPPSEPGPHEAAKPPKDRSACGA